MRSAPDEEKEGRVGQDLTVANRNGPTQRLLRSIQLLLAILLLLSTTRLTNEAEAAITFVRNIGTAEFKGLHTELKIAIISVGVPIGNTIIIAIIADYEFGFDPPVCSDSKGNMIIPRFR